MTRKSHEIPFDVILTKTIIRDLFSSQLLNNTLKDWNIFSFPSELFISFSLIGMKTFKILLFT